MADMVAKVGEDSWDVVVIGAGPAGAVAARQLALRGRCVLLVDKARLPRDKVCGGCLGGAALDVLHSLGLGRLPQQCGGVRLKEFAFAHQGAVATIPIGRRVAVSRRTFDAALVHEAARAGAVVVDQTVAALPPCAETQSRPVTLRSPGRQRTVWAEVVIIATGLSSPSGCTTYIAPKSRVGLGAILDHPPCKTASGRLQMACSSAGYVGVTAVEGGRFDVAAAVDPQALAAAGSPGRLIHRILQDAGFPPTRDLDAVRWSGTPPLTRRATPLAWRRCLLIGDAAGYVEPFTGEGIGWAMHSALLAAALLGEGNELWTAQTAARWEQLYRQALGRPQHACRLISRLLRVRLLRQLAVWSLRGAPSFSRTIVRRLDRPIAAPLA